MIIDLKITNHDFLYIEIQTMMLKLQKNMENGKISAKVAPELAYKKYDKF